MFTQRRHDRRRFFGLAALSLAGALDWHERFGERRYVGAAGVDYSTTWMVSARAALATMFHAMRR
jgi:hypothetical protein